MRSKTAAVGMMRYLLLGLGIGIFVLLALFFFGVLGSKEVEEAERVQGAQEQVQETTPAPTPESQQPN